LLGSEETLKRLIDASYEEAEHRAELDPRSIERKITELENRRSRCMDAYEMGEYELPQLSKRLTAIKGEMAKLREFQERAEEPIEINPELITQVVDVFGSWASLPRSEKRQMLRAYRIRIQLTRPERRKIHVSQVDIGLLGDVGLYKKMKRHGIT
jgi:chromosome segregation ATPase